MSNKMLGKQMYPGEEALKEYLKDPNGTNFTRLFAAYRPLVQKVINKFGYSLLDDDDLIQEARIVCYQAARNYNAKRGVSYGVYLNRCLINRYNSLVRFEKAKKRWDEKQTQSLEYLLETNGDGFLKTYSERGKIESDFWKEFAQLEAPQIFSKLELTVFNLRLLHDYTPREISEILGISIESVYNAIRRYKEKLGTLLDIGYILDD